MRDGWSSRATRAGSAPSHHVRELDGALVAIDGRGVDLHLEADVQRRAVNLLVVDDVIESARIQKNAGITKVIAGHQGPIEDLLW